MLGTIYIRLSPGLPRDTTDEAQVHPKTLQLIPGPPQDTADQALVNPRSLLDTADQQTSFPNYSGNSDLRIPLFGVIKH